MRWCTTIALATMLAGAGCGKSAPKHIAKLVGFDKVVEGSTAGKDWNAAKVGDRFNLGDAVRTGSDSTAELSLARGGSLHMDPGTVLRFQKSPAKAFNLEVETGMVELESAGEAIEIETSLGAAIVERRGSVRLRAGDEGLKIDVLVGTVMLDSEDGEPVSLGVGQSITIDVGGAIIEDDDGDTATAKRETPDAGTGPGDTPPPGGEITAKVKGRGSKVLTDAGWKPLSKGTSKLAAGTRVRVAKKSRIEVERGNERAVVAGAAEIVIGGSNGALLEATDGDVTLRASDTEVRLVVPGGVIVARAQPGGSIVNVDVGPESSVKVKRGRIDVTGGEATETLRTGESADVAKRGVNVLSRAPKRVDFLIRAGESSTIHDPKVPTAVRFRFRDACPGEGIVEVTRRGRSFKKAFVTSAGDQGANVMLPKGTHRYRVLCVTATGVLQAGSASGKLRVRSDSGRRKLPRTAPHNVLDADGRRYTVMYQNRLPKLTFRWSEAPEGATYTLHLKTESGRSRAIRTGAAKHTFQSGDVEEGTYSLWFEGNGKLSPKTKLVVDFDNAAATAYLKPPTPTEDGKLRVQGAVIADWTVSAAGTDLPLDRQRRFSAELSRRGEETAIAIRISHPDHGVHYYLVH